MRIAKIEDLHCNAGWRDFSFLKITTDEGLTGWSEYMESYGSDGLTGVIQVGRTDYRLGSARRRKDHGLYARCDPSIGWWYCAPGHCGN